MGTSDTPANSPKGSSPATESKRERVQGNIRPAVGRGALVVAFAAVYVLWGSTYLAIRFAVETLPPLLMAGVRHLVAGVILFGIVRLRSGQQPTRANWAAAAVMGALLLVGGNGGVSWAEQTVPSGVAALLVATVSFWMVILDWLRPGGIRPTGRVILGLVLGFAGLAFLVGPSKLAGSGRIEPVGAGVLLLASLSWATGSVFSRRLQLPKNTFLGTAMQSLAGGALLVFLGLVTGEAAKLNWDLVSPRSVVALGYLVVCGSLLGFSAYTWLLRATSPARVATYAYVNPVVAMLLGWALAGEQLTFRTAVAAAVILASVALIISARTAAPSRRPQEGVATAAKEVQA